MIRFLKNLLFLLWVKNMRKVTLDWLRKSNAKLAKRFREVTSKTPPDECVLCAMFFGDEYNGEKCSFDEITEEEIEHFQQIADAGNVPIEIISLK